MISVPKSISRRSSDWKSIKRKAFLDNLDLKRNYKMYSPKRYPPAGARDQRSLPCSCWDFPRIRGEKLQLVSMPMRAVGSPPHTRGKALNGNRALLEVGITPAYAGKSRPAAGRLSSPGDHPRIRGEKWPVKWKFPDKPGSPPHTRGKVLDREGLGVRDGITPAYAGKSPCRITSAVLNWDHPRIRGEKHRLSAFCLTEVGSPPHTRGKGGIKMPQLHHIGDHPRIRGEKYYRNEDGGIGLGSPPHTRGKAERRRTTLTMDGITPAYAGKSQEQKPRKYRRRDHPRIRGEKTGTK